MIFCSNHFNVFCFVSGVHANLALQQQYISESSKYTWTLPLALFSLRWSYVSLLADNFVECYCRELAVLKLPREIGDRSGLQRNLQNKFISCVLLVTLLGTQIAGFMACLIVCAWHERDRDNRDNATLSLTFAQYSECNICKSLRAGRAGSAFFLAFLTPALAVNTQRALMSQRDGADKGLSPRSLLQEQVR